MTRLDWVEDLTQSVLNIHYEGVENIYTNHAKALCKAGLTPSNLLTRGDLWSKKDEKGGMEKEPDVNKKKNRNV